MFFFPVVQTGNHRSPASAMENWLPIPQFRNLENLIFTLSFSVSLSLSLSIFRIKKLRDLVLLCAIHFS